MSETVISTKALPEILFKLITTEKVRIKETEDMIQLVPIVENTDCTIGLRGMFAGDPNLTVDKYLEGKQAEKELE